MKKSFKEFWKEYFALCKESYKWMKKHWKGYIVFCVVITTVYVGVLYIQNVISENRFLKNKNNSEHSTEEES